MINILQAVKIIYITFIFEGFNKLQELQCKVLTHLIMDLAYVQKDAEHVKSAQAHSQLLTK